MKSSIQPRKQRKALHNAPLHKRAKQVRAHLSEELLVKFGKRSATIRKGDTVRVIRGKDAGHTGEVVEVDRRRYTIIIEGVTVTKADGKSKPKPVHASDLVLTKLDLTDKARREKLGASEADAAPPKPKAKPAAAEEEGAAPAAKPAAKKPAAKKAPAADEEESA